MDPEEKAKQALAKAMLEQRVSLDVEKITESLRRQGFRVAAMPTWGGDPSGRW